MNKQRHYSIVDRLIFQIDHAVRTCFTETPLGERQNPGAHCHETNLSQKEKSHAAGLMRVNHSGEVAAQALYRGQALTAHLKQVREAMDQAAEEEKEHLAWCEQRLKELGSHTSHLDPFWYGGAFLIGAVAGLVGDQWSLGFVAETERQVVRHLKNHLQRLPEHDKRSAAILEQMEIDENHHATLAVESGAHELPEFIKQVMKYCSKVMTTTAYYI
ncbi:MAG: 2-polyprenyl-3-methyl-6-methoxy-1,4-benzoquinone monooxygenase [Proteobacteria bacterium]|nr:2-polyprenyl-3-methyl-6-methoxy-1,4-benzoquinone monooxygenase [Pseudomonadota bacterium]